MVRPRRAVNWALSMLPASLTDCLMLVWDHVSPKRRQDYRDVGTTGDVGTPISERDSRRLLIGPVNSAGQGFAWAKAVQQFDVVSAVNVAFRADDDVFRFRADHVVPRTKIASNRRWHRAQRRGIVRGFTHVLLESGRPLYGLRPDVLAQIEDLMSNGVRVGLLWHGSDIRIPSVHAAREPDSPFRMGQYPGTEVLEDRARQNHELMAAARLPTFVSTTGLLAYVPEATWLPVVVDPASWASAGSTPALQRRRPRVVHAPSSGGLKGSALVSDVAERLHDEGLIEYRLITGVPSAQMPDVYGDADVVLDTFATGNYGVAACEAMAAGRLVVSHVGDDARQAVVQRTGWELPVVQSRTSELERVLRDVVTRPEEFRNRIDQGREFVREIHDGRYSAQALRPFLMDEQSESAARQTER